MQQEKRTKLPNNVQLEIQFTPKSITSWGGTSSIISKFVNKIGLQEFIKETFPFEKTSINSTGIFAKIISTFITILNNGSNFLTCNFWVIAENFFKDALILLDFPNQHHH